MGSAEYQSVPPGMAGQTTYEQSIRDWADPGVRHFETPEAEAAYTRRVKRVLDALALREPDQVPVHLMTIGYLLGHGDIQPKDAFYDVDKFVAANMKLHEEFDFSYSVLTSAYAGEAFDTLGMKLVRWPGSRIQGQAVSDDVSYQYIEDEYMREDEYDELIENPEGYLLRKFLSRICTGLQGLDTLPNLFHMVEITGFNGGLSTLGKGKPARRAIETLLRAADQVTDTSDKITRASETIVQRYGAPALVGGITFTPFDLIGDTMRCTMGIFKDFYRRPEKVVAATRALIPMAIHMGVQMVQSSKNPFVFIPLHKGSDNFMSPEQFETFYWPSLKATLEGLIEQGCIPIPFLEGTWDQRLSCIAKSPLPRGRSIWVFGQTDMARAKQKIGSWACIAGNVPASLFAQGTPAMLEKYCQDLADICAPGGGFFLFPGTIIDRAAPENIRAFINFGKKTGRH